MSKIRINELARELEVKPNVILDLLPELGVADKKTHSSSLDDDVALAIRRRITGEDEPVIPPFTEAEPPAYEAEIQVPESSPVASRPVEKVEAPVAETPAALT